MLYDRDIPRVVGWENKPVELETRSTWERRYNRKVGKAERPRAVLEWLIERKKYVGDSGDSSTVATEIVTRTRETPLYAFEQTYPFQPTARTLAIRALADIFLRHSSRSHYIWLVEGGWKSCLGPLSFSRFEDHIRQAEIYGVRSGGRWTRFGGLDHDLHRGDKEIFLEQSRVLATEFHGRDGWHQQVADEAAGGVHYFQALAVKQPYADYRDGLRARLLALDTARPDLAARARNAGMKSFAELEIFPNVSAGIRLPLSRGRTMLTDGPLTRIRYRGRHAVNVEKYVAWLYEPRVYMPRDDVHEYIARRVVARRVYPSNLPPTTQPPVNSGTSAARRVNTRSSSGERRPVRGRYALDIQDFWSGRNTPPDSLNRAIRLIAAVAPYYHATQDSAALAIEALIDGLPDVSFSDRLSAGQRGEVSRVVRQAVSSAFAAHVANAPEDAASRQRLDATHQSWAARGFNPFDKSTWGGATNALKLGTDFEWAAPETPVLDAAQVILKSEAKTAANVVKEIVRLVMGGDGEISIMLVRRVLRRYGVKPGSNRDNKPGKLMGLLRQKEWLILYEEARWHPRQIDGSQSPGKARRYGVGPALQHKIGMMAGVSQGKNNQKHPLLHHHAESPCLTDAELLELKDELARLLSRVTDVEQLTHDESEGLDRSLFLP